MFRNQQGIKNLRSRLFHNILYNKLIYYLFYYYIDVYNLLIKSKVFIGKINNKYHYTLN